MANTFKVTVLGQDDEVIPAKEMAFPFGCLIVSDVKVAGCNAYVKYGGSQYHFAETVDDVVNMLNDTVPPTYTRYVALLTQSGTGAPEAIELENTLGGAASWSYQGVGVYRLTTELFVTDATVVAAIYDNNKNILDVDLSGLPDYIDITATTNGVLTKKPIDITVYQNTILP
jgi:hypothetical protein